MGGRLIMSEDREGDYRGGGDERHPLVLTNVLDSIVTVCVNENANLY